jgi:uncharacterized protein
VAAERPLLTVSRKDLDHGPKQVRAVLPAAWLSRKLTEAVEEGGAPMTSSKGGDVDFELTPAGGDNFLLHGHVHATVDTTCGRCLGPAQIPVDGELTLLMVPKVEEGKRPVKGKRSKDSEGELEFDPDEADVATYDGETLVLDDLVREAILLELPISPLCSESCAGIRTDPAIAARMAEAKVDPRLAPLAKFKKP